MRITVNASTLVVGGGIQIGISFIQEVIKNTDIEWQFIVSKGIYNEIGSEIIKNKNIHCIDKPPAKIFSGAKSRKKIKYLVNIFKPDLVYSIGFPSYINFKQKEIGRYTNPWEINTGPLPWNLYSSLWSKLKILLGIKYRQYWAKKAFIIETQTDAAKIGISKRLGFSENRIIKIPNSANHLFVSQIDKYRNTFNNKFIFSLAAPYKHKNIQVIPDVLYILKNKYNLSPQFYLTIPENAEIWKSVVKRSKELEVENLIVNLGKISLNQCLDYYLKAKIVFLPTLMEIFSATYIEAMAMGVPIVTNDMDFARDNCGNAALFCDSDNIEDYAYNIYRLWHDQTLHNILVERGYEHLSKYPSIHEKYQMIYEMFYKIKATNHSLV